MNTLGPASMASRLAAAVEESRRLRDAYHREIDGTREHLRRVTGILVPGWEELRERVIVEQQTIIPAESAPIEAPLQDTRAHDHLQRMEKLFSLDAVTLEQILRSAAVRATDGCISMLIWENPDRSNTHDLFIRVMEVTPDEVEPVRRRIEQLFVNSQASLARA